MHDLEDEEEQEKKGDAAEETAEPTEPEVPVITIDTQSVASAHRRYLATHPEAVRPAEDDAAGRLSSAGRPSAETHHVPTQDHDAATAIENQYAEHISAAPLAKRRTATFTAIWVQLMRPFVFVISVCLYFGILLAITDHSLGNVEDIARVV
jgi:hypothetical protein